MKTLIFPITAIILSFVAYFMPDIFIPFKGYIIPLLIIIMLGMGMTLTLNDFNGVFDKKYALLLGISLQFIIMPLAALGISIAFDLGKDLVVGMMLVGTSAGGTASNVITYLARGNLALSVSMTLCSTLLSIVLMPFLTWLYIGQKVPVPAIDMLIELIKITLIPLSLGIAINTYAHKFVTKIQPLLPTISISSIVFIIAIVVSVNHLNIQKVGYLVIIAVILHNSTGLLLGYLGAKLFGFDDKIARTIAIEVGMQNSGLSVALAIKYFGGLSALPGAMFSIWHNVSGALLAGYWASKDEKEDEVKEP
ncbi:bile acid:sodium symporter family protein [Campylobacter sp. faydin G-140]|uniref:bile acid:sodium symporter family protein n=1 Tax=Campylobacter anatolicus TaxID=2829105 RepID=UPI001BA1DD9B|nr:bile acid:sodium symporter family protein [Campylobacter anatolicus]MBR8466076.1 bile acid:sodium symporter family protein [Campylobacter anatolicus]